MFIIIVEYFQERLWRKTRTPFEINEIGLVCYGTDGNRNYDYMWRSAQQTRVSVSNGS